MTRPGSELYFDETLGRLERWYCRVFGVPIVGLRIRLRLVEGLLPTEASSILDAGCGRGVIARMLARRYPQAQVVALDLDAELQAVNRCLADRIGLPNCRFAVADLTALDADSRYDLLVSVDNLEHIEDDLNLLMRFNRALQEGGTLIVHVPHYYRRWPAFKWITNFKVPGHVRLGYHLPEILERVRRAGFIVEKTGFSFGWLENIANNLGYAITAAEEKNRLVYAVAFPLLNFVAWLGRGGNPGMGAGVWVVARKGTPEIDIAQDQNPEDAQ